MTENQMVGARLRRTRKDARLTQEELAHRVGICTRHLQRIEAGARPLDSVHLLRRFARELHLSLGQLVNHLHDESQLE